MEKDNVFKENELIAAQTEKVAAVLNVLQNGTWDEAQDVISKLVEENPLAACAIIMLNAFGQVIKMMNEGE